MTVNGSPAPLFYASPTQINFQMPSGVPAGTADIVVTNEAMTSGRALGSSSQQPTSVRVVNPGLFATTNGRASALNAT